MSSVVETPLGSRIMAAHLNPIQALTGSEAEDGHGLILSAGGDGMIRSWDAVTGEPGGFTQRSEAVVTFLGVVSVSAGRIVVCVNRRGIHRWDLVTGRPIGETIRRMDARMALGSGIGPVAVLTDGGTPLLVGGGPDGRVRRWDLLAGVQIDPPSAGHDGEVLSLGGMRLRDGRAVIVSGGRDGTVRRWDPLTGEPIGEPMLGQGGPVVAVTCVGMADGRDIVIGQTSGGVIRRWDIPTGQPIGLPMNIKGSGLAGRGLAVTPDGRVLMLIGWNGSLWRWDLMAEPVAQPWPDDVAMVNAVAVVPAAAGTPLLVSASEKGLLRRWDVTGHPVGEALVGHPAAVRHMVAVPVTAESGGRALLISQGRDGARCWDARTGQPVGSPPYNAMTALNGLAASWMPDGRLLLATGVPEGIARYDVSHSRDMGLSPGVVEDTEVWGVAAGTLPDGRRFIAGAGADGSVYRIDAETGEAVGQPLRGLKRQALAVAVTILPDGVVMIAGGGEDQTILRWNAVTGELIGQELTGHEAWVTRLAFVTMPRGQVMLISVDDHGQVRRWDAISGEPLGEPFVAGGEEISELRLTVADTIQPPELLTVGDDETVRRWDATSGRLLQELPNVTCAAAVTLPKGRRVLAVGAADGAISIIHLAANAGNSST